MAHAGGLAADRQRQGAVGGECNAGEFLRPAAGAFQVRRYGEPEQTPGLLRPFGAIGEGAGIGLFQRTFEQVRKIAGIDIQAHRRLVG